MSFLGRVKTGRRFGAIMLATIVGGALACNVDRTELNFQEGDYVFEFLADQSVTEPVPAGTNAISRFAVAAVDITRAGPDEFSKSTPGNRSFYSSTGSQYGGAYNITNFLSTAASDLRTPALVEDDVTLGANPDGLVLLDDSGVGLGNGLFNIFNDEAMSNLKPNQEYILAFYRYALNVSGEVDHIQTLAGLPVDQPDALVVDGGTGPAGDPTAPIVSYPTFIPYTSADANPFIVGNFTTDANGDGFFDGIVDGGGVFFYNDASGDPPDAAFDSSIVARNDGTATMLPRYNYVVILEGPATDAADAADNPQAVRFQIGQDAQVGGTPIENAYAPYPSGPVSTIDLLATNVAAGKADSLTMTFENLPDPGGQVYQVWLWNEETGDLLSPAGNWTAVDPEDTEVGSGTGVQTFTSQYDWTHTFVTSDVVAGQSVGDYTHALLTVETTAASTPSDVQPLWTQYTNMDGAPDDAFQWTFVDPADFSFGTFASGAPAMWELPAVARGEGGFWGSQCVDSDGDGRCEGTSDVLVVNVRNIPLPPEGFFYGAWLIDDDGAPIYAGDLLTTYDEGRESLRDLDGSYDTCVSGGDCPTAYASSDGLLLRSETFTQTSDLGGQQFYDMAMYYLTLMPKDAPDEPGIVILGGVMPEPLKDRKPEPEGGT
jgi:hypothetical protein